MNEQLIDILPGLRRFAWSLTQSVHDADDLLQATVERLLKKGVPDGVEVARWAFTVCRNLWIDEYRSRRVRKSTNVDTDLLEAGQIDGENDIQAQMELKKVMEIMQQLPEEQRLTLTLVSIQGMSYLDVAQALEIPVGTVMSRLARARSKLTELVRT
ncbi:RNA polymerase sigma factor [Pseudohongiella sp.]|uniref:RNA polymerase subunit sigma-70 n=1 Tax=marine sediment metagenome TaxID=412755 RepID=A0A0F9WHT9_9ZZZZ|nr:RNA polymerase sigma factor [Pseudohongiella sp.]HDZ07805.1 RNA polymerase sigma factor [Pseudohongiella sp.]HEA62878.1 RNA polymerase sigma factor [Pseudohongiella sp.]